MKRINTLKNDSNWIDELSPVNKKFNEKLHSSTKITPVIASLKFKEIEVYFNLRDRRERKSHKQKCVVYLQLVLLEQYSLEETLKTGVLSFIKQKKV